MLVKLAWGNARRAARDFSVYFLTLVFAVCLLYSFLASSDYLLALSLTDAQRASFAKAGEVLVAFAVLIDVIFCFLLGYANAFLLRRRKREFGLYLLLGLRPRQVAGVLLAECALASVAALACGLVAGVATSPVFGLIAAYVFGAPWHPEVVLASAAALQTALTFLIICVIAAGFSVASICRRPLVELMGAERVPERRLLAGAAPLRVQRVAAAVLLAVVWGTCLFNSGYFIIFVIPMGVCALIGMISIMMGAEGFPLFALGVVAVTVMLLAGYYALTTAACVRQVAAPRA